MVHSNSRVTTTFSNMICQRCLVRLQSSSLAKTRFFSVASSVSTLSESPSPSSSRGPPTDSHEGRPAATSTSAAQPFSTPLMPVPKKMTPSGSIDQIEAILKSSVPAGTPLKGLGYLKNKDPPVALEDHEYPAWLWTLLDQGQKASKQDGSLDGDLFGMAQSYEPLLWQG